MKVAQEKNVILSPSESPAAANVVEMVKTVGGRIVVAAGLENRARWEFITVKSNNVNAFAMPNGKIVVFTGILSVAKTEGGLAAVLGHEVSHVVARHGAERASQTLLVNFGLKAADVALAASNTKYAPLVGAALGVGAQYGILLPYSREHESEADHLGILLMARAGYDPAEAAPLWDRMQAAGKSGPWQFLSTHPSPDTRASQLREWLPEAQVFYADRSRPLPQNLTQLSAMRTERAQSMAAAPEAPLVAMPIGYSYKAQSSNQQRPYQYRIEKGDSCPGNTECFIIKSEDGRSSLQTRDFCLAEQRAADGSLQFRFSPPLQFYQWPLRVGNTWTQSVTSEDGKGKAQKAILKGEVAGYETITTRAGTFFAYKILTSVNGRLFREAWYAPEAGQAVRITSYDSQGRATTNELIELKKLEAQP